MVKSGFLSVLMSVFLLPCIPALGQEVKLSVTVKAVPDAAAKESFRFSGTITGSTLYPKGQLGVGNDVTVTLEYIEPGGKFRTLPEWYNLRHGPAKGKTILTPEEQHGIKAKGISLFGTGLSAENEGKAIKFDKVLKVPQGAAAYRVVAVLTHRWSGTWTAIVYKHDVYTPAILGGTGGTGGGTGGGGGNGNKLPNVSKTPPITIDNILANVPEGNIMGTVVSDPAGSLKDQGLKASDDKQKIENLQKEISNTNTPADIRKMLNTKRNNLIQWVASEEIMTIWVKAAGTFGLDAIDKALGYYPATGAVWAVTTAIVQAARGKWGDAMIRATGIINTVKVGGKVITDVGTKISLFLDGMTLLDEVTNTLGLQTPTSPGRHTIKSYGYIHHNVK